MQNLTFVNADGIIYKTVDKGSPYIPLTQIQFTVYLKPFEIVDEYLEDQYLKDLTNIIHDGLGIDIIQRIYYESSVESNNFHRIYSFIEFPTKFFPRSYNSEDKLEFFLAKLLMNKISTYARNNGEFVDLQPTPTYHPSCVHQYSDGNDIEYSDVELQFYSSDFLNNYEHFNQSTIQLFGENIKGIEFHTELGDNGMFKLTCLSPEQAQFIVKSNPFKFDYEITSGGIYINEKELKSLSNAYKNCVSTSQLF